MLEYVKIGNNDKTPRMMPNVKVELMRKKLAVPRIISMIQF